MADPIRGLIVYLGEVEQRRNGVLILEHRYAFRGEAWPDVDAALAGTRAALDAHIAELIDIGDYGDDPSVYEYLRRLVRSTCDDGLCDIDGLSVSSWLSPGGYAMARCLPDGALELTMPRRTYSVHECGRAGLVP